MVPGTEPVKLGVPEGGNVPASSCPSFAESVMSPDALTRGRDSRIRVTASAAPCNNPTRRSELGPCSPPCRSRTSRCSS